MSTSSTLRQKLIHIAVLGTLAGMAAPATAGDVTWTGGTGNWSVAGNWNPGLPADTDNVIIDNNTGVNSAVTLNINKTINNLTVDANDSLSFENRALTINGTTVLNNGVISLSSSGGNTGRLLIGNANTTFSGAGVLSLNSNVSNSVGAPVGVLTNVLTNASLHTIRGSGDLGDNLIGLNNQGTILANQLTPLIINTSAAGMINTGTLRANGGQLTITDTVLNNAGGTIEALNSSSVLLTGNSVITGGTLQTDATGLINLAGGAKLNGLTNTGQVVVLNYATGYLQGSIANTGDIRLDANSGGTTVLKIQGDVTLTGAGTGTGTLSLNNNTSNSVSGVASTDVLTNTSTHIIRGGGQLGDNQMGLNNQGLILANQTTPLTINASTAAGMINTGTLRADGGQLTIQDTALNNAGGTIEGRNGSHVLLRGSTITGGTLVTDTGSEIRMQSLGTLAYSRLKDLTNTGQVALQYGTSYLQGSIANTGVIKLNAGDGNQTILLIDGNVSLTGSGTLTMGNNASNIVRSNADADVLTNTSNHIIQGSGRLGDDKMGINNQGLILANQTTALTINTSATGGLTNSGTLQANAGSTMNITDAFTNSGTIRANGGTVNAAGGFTAASGTVLIEGNGIVSIGANSSTSTLTHNGSNAAGLSLGTKNLTVLGDYTNANWGVGNTFNRRANVSGTGQILAGGDVAQAVTGANVTAGTGVAPVLTIGNVHVGANNFAYQVANNGTTGPALRGALQTSVNGGNISDSRLSGSGVTASNWGPVATGGNSGDLNVVFTAGAAGALAPLSGQKVNIANNFDNVANQNLNIVLGTGAAAYRYAQPGPHSPEPVNLGNIHVGGSFGTQALSVQNTATNDGYSEKLNASIGAATGNASASGSFNLLEAQSTNSTNLVVGLGNANTNVAGAKTGTASISFVSDGQNTSGLGQTALVGQNQTVTVNGGVYRLAEANNLGAVSFGNVHVGDTVQQALNITNTAVNDAFSEKLNASFGASSDVRITTSGSINQLVAGSSNNSSMIVGLNTSAAGTVNGTQVVKFASDGAGTSGLGITELASQTIGVSGDITTSGSVFRLASASPVTPNPVYFGNVRINTATDQVLTISNTAANDGYSEKLNASISSNGAPVTANGTFTLLGPQATDSTSLHVGIDTSSAGAKSGSATIALVSDGTGTSNLGTTNLASQTVNVSGDVYRLANPTLNTPTVTIAARVGDPVSANQAVSITNTSPDIYTEGLKVAITGTSGNAQSNGGSIANLAAQGTNNSAILVGLANTATAGMSNGQVTLGLTSTGAGTTGAADDESLASKVVDVVGKVYQQAAAAVQNVVDFGIVHVGDVVGTRNVQVKNNAPVAALNDTLKGGIGGAAGPFSASGNFAGLAVGDMDSTSLNVGLNTGAAGDFNGSATVGLASHNPDMTDLKLSDVPVTLLAKVYNYANADLNKTSGAGNFDESNLEYTLDFGNVVVGTGPLTAWLEMLNNVAGPADTLKGSFAFLDSQDFGYGEFVDFSGLDAGQRKSGLSVVFNASQLGTFSDDILLTTTGYNRSDYSGDRPNITLHVHGNVVGASVPEPGTLALVGIALAGLLLSRRRVTLH